jgi:hypothetical protein
MPRRSAPPRPHNPDTVRAYNVLVELAEETRSVDVAFRDRGPSADYVPESEVQLRAALDHMRRALNALTGAPPVWEESHPAERA